ncbi:hypothetical protein AB9P05_01480 [Roseivirga sp. BDSF3-8]|uniref:hypothetical protein n=1 Tax=Roseivirga sp. BDSF3-8 TaxID=3241598 RepID=UPI0035324F96
MKLPLITFALLCLLVSCDAETRHDEAYEQNTEEEDVDIASEDFEVESISFECSEAVFDQQGTPTATLYALFDRERVEVAKVNNCNEVAQSDYPSYHIHPDAEAAIYSLHAGYGQYFYATIEDGKAMIYRVQRDETETGDFTYQAIAEYGAEGYSNHVE